ncbi:MAG: hypothetical protein K6E51_02755 [Treponema sp.]|nr:hypothetical protein [Treponema sp.]
MKKNIRTLMDKNIVTFMALVAAIMIAVPFAKSVLYILFGIDVASVIVLGIVTCIGKLKKKNLPFVPKLILAWVLYNMALFVSLSRNVILTEAFEDQNKVSTHILGKNTSITNVIVSAVIFLCLMLSGLIVLNTGKSRVKDQWESIKNEGNKEKIEFYGYLDGSVCYLNGTFVFILFMTPVIFLAGSLVGYLVYGKPIIDCIKESAVLAMGTSIVFQGLFLYCNFIVSHCLEWFE